MIDLKKITDKDIYSFHITKQIDKDAMQDFFHLLEEKALNCERLKLLAVVDESPDFENFEIYLASLKAKQEDFGTRIKYAVISDRDWIGKLIPIANSILPKLPIRFFEIGQMEKAIEWLESGSLDQKAEKYLSKMNIEYLDEIGAYSYTIDGKIDAGSMKILQEIHQQLPEGKKVKILAVAKNFEGFESFEALFEAIKADVALLSKLDKYAILSDQKWLRKVIELSNAIIPKVSLKAFQLEKRDQAIEWLGEE